MSLSFYKATTFVLSVGVIVLALVCIFNVLVISQQRTLILDMARFINAGCPTSY